MDTELFATLSDFKPASRKHRITDDDFVDRLNRYITPILICFFSIMICAKQYVVGEPIQCWTPKEFSEAWEDYSENYCWVSNTYFVAPQDQLPKTTVRSQQEIKYYQWVPFVLALQAALFLIPSIVWKNLNGRTGMDIKSFVSMAIDATMVEPKNRDDNVRMLARHIKLSLLDDWENESVTDEGRTENRQENGFRRMGFLQGYRGIYVSSAYIFVKVLYVINIIGQFYLLYSFLDTEYKLFGIQLLSNLVQGRNWQHSGLFPRVTMCDFNIRALGQSKKYSIQCVLVINLFNEKIYIFLWFWFALIAFLTLASLATWLFWFVMPSWKEQTVHKFLKRLDHKQIPKTRLMLKANDKLNEDASLINREQQETQNKNTFVKKVLHSDGLFMLRMIASNAGEPIVFDIVTALWYDLINVRKLEEGEEGKKDTESEPERPEESAPQINNHEEENADGQNPHTSSTAS